MLPTITSFLSSLSTQADGSRNRPLYAIRQRFGLRRPQFGRAGFAPARNPDPTFCENFTTEIYQSISDIEKKSWDRILGTNSIVRSHDYLAAVEGANIRGCQLFFPVVSRVDGSIAAHACVYLIDTDFAQLLPKPAAWLVRHARTIWPRFLLARVTECASPLSASHSISVEHGDEAQTLVTLIGAAVEEIARQQRSNLVVIRDFLTDERTLFDVFQSSGYNVVSNMPLARIKVRWSSYDEYLASMRSRYRKDIVRRLKLADGAGQTVHLLDTFGGEAKRWVAQAKTVWEKTKGFKREFLSPEYYEQMDRKLGGKSALVAAKRDNKWVAHGMILHDDTDTVATYFGRDNGPAKHEWFQLVNEVIRIGIERQSRYINLGLGSYDAKSNVGADVEPLFVYSKSSIRWVNWLMRVIPDTMDCPIDEAKRVFRSTDDSERANSQN